MKAIVITIKPKWAKLIGNGDKKLEIRTSVALANAIRKLITEYGKARIYVAISKSKPYLFNRIIKGESDGYYTDIVPYDIEDEYLCGKVAFMFECENVGDIKFHIAYSLCDEGYHTFVDRFYSDTDLRKASCLNGNELMQYLKGEKDNEIVGYAIRISNLMRFEKPKEIKEFKTYKKFYNSKDTYNIVEKVLTKSPQNFAYVEVENENHGR